MIKLIYRNPKYKVFGDEGEFELCRSNTFGSILLEKVTSYSTTAHATLLTNKMYAVNISQFYDSLKIGESTEVVETIVKIESVPVVCKKRFSKNHVTKTVELSSTGKTKVGVQKASEVKIQNTTDKYGNKVSQINFEMTDLPKKIKGLKTLEYGQILTVTVIVKTIPKPMVITKSQVNSCDTSYPARITKRKFEVPYPIKLAAGIVAFFGVLEVGSALISKIVNKIK